MKYAILENGSPAWWSTLEGAQDEAIRLFAQTKGADFVHVYTENDFMHPILTVCREGYGGPASENRIEVPTA